MKKLLSIVLSFALLLSMFTAIPVVAVEGEEAAVSTALGDYYKFTFGENGDRYDYTVANKTIGDTKGQATFKGNTFYPLLIDNTNASKASSAYKTITTPKGETYDVLEIRNLSDAFLVPLTKDGTPYEFIPGVKYTVSVKFFNPTCNTWGQMMVSAGGLDEKVASYNKEVNGVSWSKGEAIPKNNVMVNAPFRMVAGGAVSGRSFSLFLKEGTYGTSYMNVPCICSQYSTAEKPIVCTHNKEYLNAYKESTGTIGIPEANGVKNANGTYSTKYSYADKTPEDTSDDVYVEGHNYLTLSLKGNNVAAYKEYPIYSNATAEEITADGGASTWQIVSIEVVSENFKSGIDYIVNGEIVKSVEGGVGTAIENFVPEIPEGKFFAGWYADEELTVPYTAEAIEFGKKTVYAKFYGYGQNLELNFDEGKYPSTAVFYDEAGTKWPLTGYSYKGGSYDSTTNHGELEADLERKGFSTTIPEGVIAFYSDRTWAQPGGLVFANPDGSLFIPKAGNTYRITYKYRSLLNNGNDMAINVVYGIADSFGNKSSTEDKNFSKSTLATNDIEDAVTEWTEETVVVTIPEERDGYVPALGFSISAVKKVAVDAEDTTAGYNYTMVELDYVIVNEVKKASFVIPKNAVLEHGGIRIGNVVHVYAEMDEKIVAPIVIDADGNPIETWYDTDGNEITEFESDGKYLSYVATMYGDCNNDKLIDTTDLAVLKLNLAGLGEVGLGGDCDGNGKIDTTDLAVLKLYLAGVGNLATDDKDLKVLGIGNSFTVDGTQYLWDVANAAGAENFLIAKAEIGGCSLDKHWDNIQNDATSYSFSVNDSGKWLSNGTVALSSALEYEDWDVIVIQQVSQSAGDNSTYLNLQNIIDYIKSMCPQAKIMWQMTWAYQGNSTHSGFAKYDNDQMTMYNAIIDTANELIVTNPDIAGIIPSGTAIQNLRTALGDNLTRDGFHLSYDYGRYCAAMTWYKAITGKSIDSVDWVPEDYSYVSEKLDTVKAAVNNAAQKPFEVTDLTK